VILLLLPRFVDCHFVQANTDTNAVVMWSNPQSSPGSAPLQHKWVTPGALKGAACATPLDDGRKVRASQDVHGTHKHVTRERPITTLAGSIHEVDDKDEVVTVSDDKWGNVQATLAEILFMCKRNESRVDALVEAMSALAATSDQRIQACAENLEATVDAFRLVKSSIDERILELVAVVDDVKNAEAVRHSHSETQEEHGAPSRLVNVPDVIKQSVPATDEANPKSHDWWNEGTAAIDDKQAKVGAETRRTQLREAPVTSNVSAHAAVTAPVVRRHPNPPRTAAQTTSELLAEVMQMASLADFAHSDASHTVERRSKVEKLKPTITNPSQSPKSVATPTGSPRDHSSPASVDRTVPAALTEEEKKRQITIGNVTVHAGMAYPEDF
jgi:hypothetical protein